MVERLLLAVVLVVAACVPSTTGEPGPGGAAPGSFPQTVTDFQGQSVVVDRRPERIVSIGPSNTEFLYALGAGDRVVGVDDFSDEPAPARDKEKVGGVKVNVERVLALRPDLVVTVKITDGSLEKIAAQSITVLVIDPVGVADVIRTANVLGNAIGADGAALGRSIQGRIDGVKTKALALKKKRVFHEVDASDPTKPFTVGPGSFVHEIIGLAGGTNIAERASSPYPQISAEEIIRADPEIIVLANAAYGMTLAQVLARPGWAAITAVRNRRIVPVDPNLVSRPGPRLPEALEAYHKIISETP
jgi:iron complex transport system substrate-binding protein